MLVSLGAAVTAVYLGVLVLFGVSTHESRERRPVGVDADSVLVVVTMKSLQPTVDRVHAEVTIYPGDSFLDANGVTLAVPLSVLLVPAVSQSELFFPAHSVPVGYPVELLARGQAIRWPFDTFDVTPVVVEADVGEGAEREPVPSDVLIDGRIDGWAIDQGTVVAASELGFPDGVDGTEVVFTRTGGTLVYAAILLLMMVVLAVLAVFVAVQTFRRRRAVETEMLAWMAAMLFAVVPLRGILPGSPPIGSWIDVAVTMWVVTALVAALTLYVYCWWRDSHPSLTRR
ncbi:DUF4436 family protein [Rhodococcus sp. 14C212]|uniref:DUF4436 family protein n=1 Tax=Rhodococcus sp. 14C212 TaxID=2711209 RepID=UPI0013EE072F|nr:DUF4436 family protein [Rhodococcus sp. 14C212]